MMGWAHSLNLVSFSSSSLAATRALYLLQFRLILSFVSRDELK
jgi:hypothetical protein